MEMQAEARALIATAGQYAFQDELPYEAIARHLPTDPARLAVLMRATAHLLVPDQIRHAECVIQITLERASLKVGARFAGRRPQDYYLPHRVRALRLPKHGG